MYTPGQPTDPHQPRFALVVSADARNRARDHAPTCVRSNPRCSGEHIVGVLRAYGTVRMSYYRWLWIGQGHLTTWSGGTLVPRRTSRATTSWRARSPRRGSST